MYADTFKRLLNRPSDSHKYSFGHVLILGGSSGMVGAPFLAGQAALRVGAGLVTIGSDKPVIEKLERRTIEIMTLAVSTNSAQSAELVQDYIQARKVSVIVIGPGFTSAAAPLVQALLANLTLPTVIDGGGLSILASEPTLLQNRATNQLILTPHMGELQRFFTQPLPKDPAALVELAKEFTTTNRLTLVIKGPSSQTITADGRVYHNTTGGPALATAGTGDVLAGMIGGIIGQGITPEKAVPAAVYLHGKAGDLAAELETAPGVIASDVIDCIPKALKSIEQTLT